jgi:orotidine-5'-phosphate decarboxylase
VTWSSRLISLTTAGPVLCAGIDPHPEILEAWGHPDTPGGLAGWAENIRGALGASAVAVVKPQVALFERHGVAGMTVLAELLGELRQAGHMVIGDAKRGDIGSTMEGYAHAWLGVGSDFEVDALTLVAYQGVGALEPALELAQAHGKGIFVLAATSNSEAWPTQSAVRSDGLTVAAGVVADLASWTGSAGSPGAGIVVGATVDQARFGLNLGEYSHVPVLAPGYGAQGAMLSRVREHFPHSQHVIAVSARDLLRGGPEEFAARWEAAQTEVNSA